jgi:hypothetical protein
MMRYLTITQRLALLLTGLYLIGISLYAVIVWRMATTENVDVNSPLIYREAVKHSGERERVQLGAKYMSSVYARVDDRFDWLLFCVVTAGGVAALWLILPGTVWLVRVFRSQPPKDQPGSESAGAG